MPAGNRSRLTSRNSSRDAHSRSPSRSPSQYSKYSDQSGSYSNESFDSEEHSSKKKSAVDKRQIKRNTEKAKVPNGRVSKSNSISNSGNKNNSKDSQHYVVRRMLSARRMKIDELKNEVESVTQHHSEIQTENKLLKKQLAMQHRALHKYEDSEGDISTIMSRHANEVRILKEQNRKYKDKLSYTEKKLQSTDAELRKIQSQLKKAKQLNEENGVLDKNDLLRKFNNAEKDCEEKTTKFNELTRHVENLQKNHKHQLGIDQARYKAAQKYIKELTAEVDSVKQTLREREKELDVRNIYYKRVIKVPHKLGSRRTTPSLRERRLSEASSRGDDFRDADSSKENNLQEDLSTQKDNYPTKKEMDLEDRMEKLRIERMRQEEEMKQQGEFKRQEQSRKDEEKKKQIEIKRLEKLRKEEELRQQQEMETQIRKEKEKAAMDAADLERKKQRDMMKAKMMKFDPGDNTSEDYVFNPPRENSKVKTSKQKDEDLVFGSYAPTFGGGNLNKRLSRKSSNQSINDSELNKKPSLLDDLFGSGNINKENIENTTIQPDTKSFKSRDNSFTRNDSLDSGNADTNKVLSRRPRHNNNVLNTRTMINGMNDFEDGIEELAI